MRLTLLLCAVAAYAQTPPSQPPAAGLEPAWNIAVVVEEIGTHAGRLLPLLDQADARAWVAKGASETYLEQLEAGKQQTRALESDAAALARNPERLSAALQLFFRIQGLETLVRSVEEGAAKYQSPKFAQSLASLFAEGGPNRERLRAYIVSPAAEREQQFEVMDREAQRCRGSLMAPTPPPKSTGRKK